MYVIRCVGVEGTLIGGGEDPTGKYLSFYDPEFGGGYGMAEWSTDAKEAMTFATTKAAVECYRTIPATRPRRSDGLPNRPLSAYSVEIMMLL
jgi:hypothetical protein